MASPGKSNGKRDRYAVRKHKLQRNLHLHGPFAPNHTFIRTQFWPVEDRQHFKKAFAHVMGKNFFGSDGPSDDQIKAIHADMPEHVCLEEVKYYIRREICRIEKQRRQYSVPIDKWVELLDAVSPDYGIVEQQIKASVLVATEEQISQPSSKSQANRNLPEPDYDTAYKYIACAIANEPLPKLSPTTALLIEDCLQSLTEQIKSLEDGELRQNLRRIYRFLTKAPSDVALEEGEEEVSQQLHGTSTLFNPLGINQHAIVPVPPNLV